MSRKITRLPAFTPKARSFWESLPPGVPEMLLGNVFCGNCRCSVQIVDYSGEMDGGDLVLRGTCATCGGPVARLVEAPETPYPDMEPCAGSAQAERFYLLRVSLVDAEPEIWRRFMVPGSITLDRLHDVLQIVMGWQDYHMHEFTVGKKRYGASADGFNADGCLAEGGFRLAGLVRQKGRSFSYLYDFGDSWEHEVLVEESRFHPVDIHYPLWCLDGAGACPPEDVGGLPGYGEFCRVMADRRHGAHRQYREWYGDRQRKGGGFDPAFVDLEGVNDDLVKYQSWSRDRTLPRGAWEV